LFKLGGRDGDCLHLTSQVRIGVLIARADRNILSKACKVELNRGRSGDHLAPRYGKQHRQKQQHDVSKREEEKKEKEKKKEERKEALEMDFRPLMFSPSPTHLPESGDAKQQEAETSNESARRKEKKRKKKKKKKKKEKKRTG
jgi:hypothetical protein